MKVRTLSVVAALAVSLAVVASTGAGASRVNTTPRAAVHAPAALGALGGPGDVPWSLVGKGWLLAMWQPVASRAANAAPNQFLVLVSPTGSRYDIAAFGRNTSLFGWSGDGQRALLVTQGTKTTIAIVDLHTGAIEHSFVFPTSNSVFFESAGFTRPSGLALDVSTQTNDHQLVTRYSFDGVAQQNYPTTFGSLGRSTGSWLQAPNGATLVMGALRGLAIVGNGGRVVTSLPIAGAKNDYCVPLRWWTATVVLARCSSQGQLWEFPTNGGTPRALTRHPVSPDAGDMSAWHVGPSVYVQVSLGCGAVWLAELHGHAPLLVHVPHVSMSHSLFVIGATPKSLALQSTLVCSAGQSLLWYTPSTNAEHVVLGPPVTSGGVNAAVIYPTPFG